MNTLIIPKKGTMSLTKPITEHINTTLPNPQMVNNNDLKYQKLKFNKKEFKNLVTKKIATIHEFSRNKLQLRFQIPPLNQHTMSDKTQVKFNFRAIGEDFTVEFVYFFFCVLMLLYKVFC